MSQPVETFKSVFNRLDRSSLHLLDELYADDVEFRDPLHRIRGLRGRMLIQAITVTDQRYERVRKSVDFIKQFIFPGSCLPSVTRLCDALTQATDLRLLDLEDITAHYPVTLRRWRERFLANLPRVQGLGYPDSFIRMWELYLRYCEAGFMERYIRTVQMVMHKPLWRGGSFSPVGR